MLLIRTIDLLFHINNFHIKFPVKIFAYFKHNIICKYLKYVIFACNKFSSKSFLTDVNIFNYDKNLQ